MRRRAERLPALREAKAGIEARGREAAAARGRRPDEEGNPKGGQRYKRAYGDPAEQAQDPCTDPQRRLMKTSAEGDPPCDNAQWAVDGANPLLVSTQGASSARAQGPWVKPRPEWRAIQGKRPARVLADAGDCHESDLGDLEALGVDGYGAWGRAGRRTGAVDTRQSPARARRAAQVAPEAGRARYAARKWLSEAPSGWSKAALGLRRVSGRGLHQGRGEGDLGCRALNIQRRRGCWAAAGPGFRAAMERTGGRCGPA